MRLLVFGSRSYGVIPYDATPQQISRALAQVQVFVNKLDEYREVATVTAVISGGAKGADDMAIEYAKARGIPLEVFHADWGKYGKLAGPIRNKQMLTVGKPDKEVGFIDRNNEDEPVSPGSRNMYEQCVKAKVPAELYQ